MPRAFRLLLLHVAVGFGLATLLLAMLVWTDPGGLAGLLLRPQWHPWPMLLLWFFLGLSFGAVQVAVAVMQEGRG